MSSKEHIAKIYKIILIIDAIFVKMNENYIAGVGC